MSLQSLLANKALFKKVKDGTAKVAELETATDAGAGASADAAAAAAATGTESDGTPSRSTRDLLTWISIRKFCDLLTWISAAINSNNADTGVLEFLTDRFKDEMERNPDPTVNQKERPRDALRQLVQALPSDEEVTDAHRDKLALFCRRTYIPYGLSLDSFSMFQEENKWFTPLVQISGIIQMSASKSLSQWVKNLITSYIESYLMNESSTREATLIHEATLKFIPSLITDIFKGKTPVTTLFAEIFDEACNDAYMPFYIKSSLEPAAQLELISSELEKQFQMTAAFNRVKFSPATIARAPDFIREQLSADPEQCAQILELADTAIDNLRTCVATAIAGTKSADKGTAAAIGAAGGSPIAPGGGGAAGAGGAAAPIGSAPAPGTGL